MNSLNIQELLEFMKNLAVRAGKTAESGQFSVCPAAVKTKSSPLDIVTEVDRNVEKLIISAIAERFPDHGIFGEETGRRNGGSPYLWIIDPIDGTTSFVHHEPNYAVSIGLHHDGKPLAGAVYAPAFDELFFAAAGTGAFRNGVRLRVSDHAELAESVVSTGFSCLRQGWKNNNLPFFCEIAPLVRGIRRYGAASLDVCWVAAGREDAYWELNLQPYDYAAGLIVLSEAGGRYSDCFGGNSFPEKGFLATNGVLHEKLLPFFKDYKAARK